MTKTNFGRLYFSKPPYKSFFFWMCTVYLLVVISMAVLFGARFYGRLGPSGVGGGLWWMCLFCCRAYHPVGPSLAIPRQAV